jgi:hypothetical protein
MSIAWIDLPQAVIYFLRGIVYLSTYGYLGSVEATTNTLQNDFRIVTAQIGDWSNISATVLCLGLAMIAVSIVYFNGISAHLKAQRWIWVLAAGLIPLPGYFMLYAIQMEWQPPSQKVPIWQVGREAGKPENCQGPFCFLPDPILFYFYVIVVMNVANILTSFLGWYRIRQFRTEENKHNSSRAIMMRLLLSFGIANFCSWAIWLFDQFSFHIQIRRSFPDPVRKAIYLVTIFFLAARGMLHAFAVYYTLLAAPKPNAGSNESETSLKELSHVKTFAYSQFAEKTSISILSEPEPTHTIPEREAVSPQWSVSEKASYVTDITKYP